MAAQLDNRCPICLESWERASYVMPCLHQFCYECILRWADSKPECPLCRRRVTSILHSVQEEDDFQERAIPPPATPSVAVSLTGGAPGHPAAHNLHRPAASQPSAAGLVPRAPVDSLQPHIWAFLFREDPALLRPLLPWLQQELWLLFEGDLSETSAAQRIVLVDLPLFGLHEEALLQLLQPFLGRHTSSFARRLIDTVVRRCSREGQRRMGLGDARAAEEQDGSPAAAPGPAASQGGSPATSPAHARFEAEDASTSSAALQRGPGSPSSAPIPASGEPEEQQQDSEEAVPRASTPSQRRQHSPQAPWRAPKRRAGSPQDPSQPPNKPPHHQ